MDPESLPDKHVRARYEMNRSTYVHPELRTADHILVSEMVKMPVVDWCAETDRPRPNLQAALAEEINEGLKARPVSNRDAFLARANSNGSCRGSGSQGARATTSPVCSD